MPNPVYEEGDVTVLWNQAVHADREVTENRPHMIIKTKKRYMWHTRKQKCRAKGRGKEIKIQEFSYRDPTNVELEIYDYTSYYRWNRWNSNEKLKENPGSYTRKTFDRFTTENSYTWNITHNKESTAV
jgi:hypothetical protein